MSVCRFVKGMPRWRSRVRLIVRQSILPCRSVRPTTLIRSICLVFDVARQIHVRTMLRPAHYHILAMSTQGFCVRLRDDISPPYCAARKQRCFMDHGWGRWSGRSCCRLSRRLDRFLFSFAPHNQPFAHRPPRSQRRNPLAALYRLYRSPATAVITHRGSKSNKPSAGLEPDVPPVRRPEDSTPLDAAAFFRFREREPQHCARRSHRPVRRTAGGTKSSRSFQRRLLRSRRIGDCRKCGSAMDSCDESVLTPRRKRSITVLSPQVAPFNFRQARSASALASSRICFRNRRGIFGRNVNGEEQPGCVPLGEPLSSVSV